MSQPSGYIVRRLLVDGHAGGGDTWGYVRVIQPKPGETIYHGQFTKRMVPVADNGPCGSDNRELYVPVDESKLTSEPFNGGEAAETF